jgi:hypothetical protein
LEIPKIIVLKSLLHLPKFNPKALSFNGFQNHIHSQAFTQEEERKMSGRGRLTVLLLKDPLCAMLPTRNQSPTRAMAPKVQGLMREERRARDKGENG